MVSKILLPHDGTEMSDKALKKALELAIAFKSQLILLHVIDEIPVSPSISDSILINRARKSIRREMQRGWEKLVEVKTHEIESTNVDMTDYCLVGSAAEQILSFANNNKIDIIVMASRRFKGFSKIKTLGSVTRKVSEMADCPVLIVH